MKKLFLFLLLISQFAFSQDVAHFPYQPVYPVVLPSAKINLTNPGHEATSPGWNNLYFTTGPSFVNWTGTPLALNAPNGTSTGWTVTESMIVPSNSLYDMNTGTFFTTDFPNDVLKTQHVVFLGPTGQILLAITGLNPAKTYTIETCNANTDIGDGANVMTVIGISTTSQTAPDPSGIATPLTFTGVAPDGTGLITITDTNPSGNSSAQQVLNAVIIKQE